jgi:hypothetical protein
MFKKPSFLINLVNVPLVRDDRAESRLAAGRELFFKEILP